MKRISMDKVTALNHEAGQHYFEKGTMRFFRSRIPKTAWETEDGRRAFFWTSEQSASYRFGLGPRLFSVRVQYLDGPRRGQIDTVGTFQGFAGPSSALAEVKRLASKWDSTRGLGVRSNQCRRNSKEARRLEREMLEGRL